MNGNQTLCHRKKKRSHAVDAYAHGASGRLFYEWCKAGSYLRRIKTLLQSENVILVSRLSLQRQRLGEVYPWCDCSVKTPATTTTKTKKGLPIKCDIKMRIAIVMFSTQWNAATYLRRIKTLLTSELRLPLRRQRRKRFTHHWWKNDDRIETAATTAKTKRVYPSNVI